MELRKLPFEEYYEALRTEVGEKGLPKAMEDRGTEILDLIRDTDYMTYSEVAEKLQEIWHMIQITEEK